MSQSLLYIITCNSNAQKDGARWKARSEQWHIVAQGESLHVAQLRLEFAVNLKLRALSRGLNRIAFEEELTRVGASFNAYPYPDEVTSRDSQPQPIPPMPIGSAGQLVQRMLVSATESVVNQ